MRECLTGGEGKLSVQKGCGNLIIFEHADNIFKRKHDQKTSAR